MTYLLILFTVRGRTDRGLCFNGECKTPCEYHNLSSCLCDRGICTVLCVHGCYRSSKSLETTRV